MCMMCGYPQMFKVAAVVIARPVIVRFRSLPKASGNFAHDDKLPTAGSLPAVLISKRSEPVQGCVILGGEVGL